MTCTGWAGMVVRTLRRGGVRRRRRCAVSKAWIRHRVRTLLETAYTLEVARPFPTISALPHTPDGQTAGHS